jgi:hypothetical protein
MKDRVVIEEVGQSPSGTDFFFFDGRAAAMTAHDPLCTFA